MYAVNGSSMNIGPASVRWVPIQTIMDLNAQPVYSGYRIEMEFPTACPADVAQWLNAVSAGAVSLTIPERWGTSFITVSDVYCDIGESPILVDVHTEPFTIIVHGVYV